MAKAVLIMDMYEDCRYCDLYDVDPGNNFYCGKTKKSIPRNEGKPDWCPLISEPERKDPYINFDGTIDTGTYQYAEAIGWNACLDALEGKT